MSNKMTGKKLGKKSGPFTLAFDVRSPETPVGSLWLKVAFSALDFFPLKENGTVDFSNCEEFWRCWPFIQTHLRLTASPDQARFRQLSREKKKKKSKELSVSRLQLVVAARGNRWQGDTLLRTDKRMRCGG